MIISHKKYNFTCLCIVRTEDYEMKQTSTNEEKKQYQEVCKWSQTFKNSCRVTWTCFIGASVACHMSISTGHWEEILYGISTSELWHARAKKKIWWSLDDQINWHGTISIDVLTDNPPQSNITWFHAFVPQY